MTALAIHHNVVFAVGDVISDGLVFFQHIPRLIKIRNFELGTGTDIPRLRL